MDVRARHDLAIRRLVHSDIVNNVVPRAGVMVCTEEMFDRRDAGYVENVRGVHR